MNNNNQTVVTIVINMPYEQHIDCGLARYDAQQDAWIDGGAIFADDDGCPTRDDDMLYADIASALKLGRDWGRVVISGIVIDWEVA